ncbi:hypothetical protein GCM10027442_16480 [Emticicia fontis]
MQETESESERNDNVNILRKDLRVCCVEGSVIITLYVYSETQANNLRICINFLLKDNIFPISF